MIWAWQKSNPTMWWWACQKRSQSQLHGFHPSLVCQNTWTVPKWLFWRQSVGDSPERSTNPSSMTAKRHYRNRCSQIRCHPGGRVCSPLKPKRQEVRAKTRLTPRLPSLTDKLAWIHYIVLQNLKPKRYRYCGGTLENLHLKCCPVRTDSLLGLLAILSAKWLTE